MPCEPPRLGRREARDLLANKTVAFVGDSVSRMMFCETAAWLFGVKGWWWQNRWVPGRSTWSPSLANRFFPGVTSHSLAESTTPLEKCDCSRDEG